MDRAEALLSIAEIAVALAGFGGIFVALARDPAAERSPANTYRLVMLLSAALSTLVLALLPVALLAFDLGERAIWTVASGAMAALITTLLVVTARYRRRHRAQIREGEIQGASNVIWILGVLMLAAQVGNAIGVFPTAAFGVFLGGLAFLVAFGAYLFARMLFLWRS